MTDRNAEHVVKGIRSILRKLKDAGLIEENTLKPQDAVEDLQSAMLGLAEGGYRAGARRGALEVLKALRNGDFTVTLDASGHIDKLVRKQRKPITWNSQLKVPVGNEKLSVERQKYELTLEDLGLT